MHQYTFAQEGQSYTRVENLKDNWPRVNIKGKSETKKSNIINKLLIKNIPRLRITVIVKKVFCWHSIKKNRII